MFNQQPTLELLFEQLGLSSVDADIDRFIQEHQLPKHTSLEHAEFWTDGQRTFLAHRRDHDDEWAIVVDTLNQLLHEKAKHD